MNDDGRRVEVAGLFLPLLALALVRRQFEQPTIGQAERLVAVEHGLDLIVAGRQVGEAPRRPAEAGRIVEDHGPAGGEALRR